MLVYVVETNEVRIRKAKGKTQQEAYEAYC